MPDGFEAPFDDQPWDPPTPSPDDRLWRHPSEMASIGPPSALAAPPRPRRLSTVVLSGLGIGLFIAGSIAMAGLMGDAGAPLPHVGGQAMFLSSTTVLIEAGWLGVNAIDTPLGVTVIACDPGSPAEVALRRGDVILAVDGAPTPTLADVRLRVQSERPGSLVTIHLLRDHVDMQMQVTVAHR